MVRRAGITNSIVNSMIPPCDPAVLDSNPQFKKLHQHLTSNLLNPDGTTRADDNDRTRRAVAEVCSAIACSMPRATCDNGRD